MKRCNLCGKDKPLEDFPIHSTKNNTVIYHPWCNECRNKEQRQRYKETRSYQLSRRKSEQRLQIYNISSVEFETLLRHQDNKCGICNTALIKPCIDHEHTTGKIRGILCSNCNAGLGFLKDSSEIVRQAAWYLDHADTGFVANLDYFKKKKQ